MAPAASLVWTVENTRWPVSDAWIAMSAVSPSRISPTMMTSGSWRRKLRSTDAKVRSILELTWDLRDALELILDRILDGEDVEVGRVDLGQAGVQRRRLAGAGRAGDEHDAVRALDELVDDHEVIVAEADVGEVEEHARAIEQTDRDALAVDAGRGRDAHVDVLAGDLAADAAVLRQALLGDVEAGHDLDARQDRVDVVAVGALDLQQVPSTR